MGDVGISADKTLLHCTDDVESCCLGGVLPCAIYGQNRKRIGAQGCCAGTMVLMVPLSLFALVARLVTGGIVDSWEVCADLHDAAVVKGCNVSGVVSIDNCDVCPVPKDCETFVDSEACSVPFPPTVYLYGWGLGVIAAIYSVLILAQNRSLLQRTLGMRDEGIVNYLVYMSLPLCALCQEARAVRSRAAQLEVQMPMAPGGRGKAHRLDFELQEEPEPEGISFFMYVTIIALFVGYWHIVIALYFYGMLSSSTSMVRPEPRASPCCPCPHATTTPLTDLRGT